MNTLKIVILTVLAASFFIFIPCQATAQSGGTSEMNLNAYQSECSQQDREEYQKILDMLEIFKHASDRTSTEIQEMSREIQTPAMIERIVVLSMKCANPAMFEEPTPSD